MTSRSILPLLLVMLQFFAPLLHAHADQNNAHFGLHIPGLESYGSATIGVFADQLKLSVSNANDGIVAIDQGIRENRTQTVDDTAVDCCLLALALNIVAGADFLDIKNFSQLPLLPSRIRPPSLSPRAPPVI